MVPAALFSFIIPTRDNPESLRQLCGSIREHTRRLDDLEIVLVIDDDDEATRRFEYPGLNIRKVEGPPRRSMGELNSAGFLASTGQYVALLNDDIILGTPSWDDQVIDVFRAFPDGMVLAHVNDTIFRETLCTFPFLTRAFCELAGGICPDDYQRYRIDDHIHNVFDLLAVLGYHRRIFLPDVVFEHLNLVPTHAGFAYVVNPEIHAIDSRRFQALLPDRKRLALAAAERIDRQAHSRDRQAWEAKLEAVSDSEALRHAAHARWRPSGHSLCANSRVTVAVVSADSRSAGAQVCIEQIKAHTTDYDLVIVDNNRGPGLSRARQRNQLLEFCRTDYLVLMDDDVFVEKGWLEGLTRAMETKVGVVTPLHKDRTGGLSYAGIVLKPDDSGDYSHALSTGQQPRPIQALSGAIMLIDMNQCGHIRMDEVYSGRFVDIDYGLRVWEQGYRVVCTPWTQVTHAGCGALAPDSEQAAQRERWRSSWVDTRRIEALRRGVWSGVPEFAELSSLKSEVDYIVEEPAPPPPAPVVTSEPVPVATPQPLPVAEAIVTGLPQLEPPSVEPVAPGFGAAMKRLGRTLPYLYLLRPRILIRRGANLFDPDYYRTANPDIVAQGVSPFLHFLTSGAFEGRSPHPLFDTAFYLRSYPDVANAKVNPLGHYLGQGAAEGRRPHPLFDSLFYLERYPDVGKSRMNPLVHYVLYGAAEGRQPHPWFQPEYYLDHCPDRKQAAANPLLHFLRAHAPERGVPHPHFDCEYYLRQNPGVAAVGMNPLVHYVLFGARAGRRPSEGSPAL